MALIDIFELRDRFPNVSSLALIGNASSVLEWNHGELIDSYDLVVRFNGAFVQGLEKQIGTRTDILVANEKMALNQFTQPADTLKPNCVLGFCKPARKFDYQPFRNWVGAIPYAVTFIPDIYGLRIQERPGSFTKGTYALYTLLNLFNFKQIFITGFNILGVHSGDGRSHTHSEAPTQYHPVDVEAKVFCSLVKYFRGQVRVTPEVRQLIIQTVPSFGKSLQIMSTGSQICATRGGRSLGGAICKKLCIDVAKKILKSGYRLRRLGETIE